ncbi:nuclear pore glycoprotein p62 [Scaptodrosophila lebanonensis]|uniref:Nuclear pore glycoprotein p62 n=1 Tax=Drosophila lebanonensis TaxID=7225 RepID=A0A6J2UJR9_DROLE|nr:nuclear pore glycoprotein p62 [Scaptodrosophila lebanonensis]
MAFQMPPTTTSVASFSFGLSPAPTTAASAAATATKPSFAFGAPVVAPNLVLAGGGDADSTKSVPPSQFGFAATPAPTAAVVAPTPKTSAVGTAPAFSGFGSLTQPTAVAPATSAAVVSTAPGTLTLGAPTPTLGMSAPPKSVAAAPAAQQATAVAVAPLPTTSAAPAGSTGSAFANLTTATKTTDSAAVVNASQMSYHQLEEHINKWTLEFEELEKVFTEQATQTNAWDKLLISNNHKIIELNDAVQKVKNDQQMLDQELEFIATQHKELEESLAPLEKEFANLPRVDMERSQTYMMVEDLDTQLKQMSEDLKEIIDNLNEANKEQDITDPIVQIGKILSAHMSSLQWIESQSSNICKKLDEIGKIHETQKRDTFRPAF